MHAMEVFWDACGGGGGYTRNENFPNWNLACRYLWEKLLLWSGGCGILDV